MNAFRNLFFGLILGLSSTGMLTATSPEYSAQFGQAAESGQGIRQDDATTHAYYLGEQGIEDQSILQVQYQTQAAYPSQGLPNSQHANPSQNAAYAYPYGSVPQQAPQVVQAASPYPVAGHVSGYPAGSGTPYPTQIPVAQAGYGHYPQAASPQGYLPMSGFAPIQENPGEQTGAMPQPLAYPHVAVPLHPANPGAVFAPPPVSQAENQVQYYPVKDDSALRAAQNDYSMQGMQRVQDSSAPYNPYSANPVDGVRQTAQTTRQAPPPLYAQQMPGVSAEPPSTGQRFAQPNLRVGFQARTTETPVPENRNYRLKGLTSVEFEKKLLDTFSRQFVPVEARPNRDGDRTIGYYRLPAADGSYLDLALDRPNGVVTITGAPRTVDSTLQLLRLLDGPTEKDGRRTEIIPYSAVHYTTLLQAIDVVEQETSGSEPEEPAGPNGEPNAPRFQNQGNLVQWQDGGFGEGRDTGGEGGMEGEPGTEGGGGIVGAVQVQVIDDINTVVLRGNKRDIEILMEMIKQLEAVGMEHKPEIVLFRMRHADAVRVTQIVLQLYNQVYSQRRGTVSLTAMKKPNAVLLVGQKESVEAAIELYKKLDLNVPPESQFLVIPLRNASSEYLATQLTTFYTENGTLSPQLRIVADTRVNALIIQGSPRDMSEVASLVRQLDAPTGDAVNQVKTFKLKNALASELATILQNAISGTTSTSTTASSSTSSTRIGSRNAALEMLQVDPEAGTSMRSGVLVDVRVTADSRSNSLIVSAPAETMPLVETLIMQLDQLPSAQSFIKLFTIVNGEAYSLAETLRELFGTTTGTTGATQSGSSQTFATTRAGTQAGDTTLVGIRFAVDVRTNSIIASGSASDLAIVEALLIRLDEENMHNREVITYRLKNTSASDVQTAINSYLTSERQLENTATTYLVPQSPLEQYRKEVVIVAEPVTNTLIISTTPRHREPILRIIEHLDDQPPMVCIQVLIAEVSLTNDCELGTQLGLQDAVLFNRSTNGIPGFNFVSSVLGGNTETTDNSTVGTQGVTHLGLNQRATSGPSGFVFSASSESLSILIRALEMSGKTQILSRPMMTTLDNKQTQLQVGEEFAAITDTQMDNDNISNTVEWKPVGIVLDVTPRITSDNLVLMEIYVERSRTGEEKDGTVIAIQNDNEVRLPRIEKTMARSSLSAMSGQTIIMGGLIQEEKTSLEVGVPFLNKIPILKHAFSYTTTSSERKELVIIMTPVVIRDEYDMEMLKQQEFGRMHWVMHDVIRVGGGKVRTRGCDWHAGETQVVPMNKPRRPDENLMPSNEDILQKVPHPALSPAPTLKSE